MNIAMSKAARITVFISVLISISLAQDAIEVETFSGPVRGRFLPKLKVYEFLGIPFAKPPVGELRFKKPVPVESWTETLEAMSYPPMCPQVSMGEYKAFGVDDVGSSEDCLYLNLWVPYDTLQNKSLKTAPYTFIHGGGFLGGNIATYNSSILSSYNKIVVATMQYRLGALGFYWDGTEDAPGNQGLWDQLEALKWLCKNFEVFGADCEKHTIGGESAGAMAVGHHMISPHSNGYFKRAIIQSGSPLTNLFVSTKEVIEEAGKSMAEFVGKAKCVGVSNVTTCLRDIPAEEFPPAGGIVMVLKKKSFTPVIDGDFIPDDPMVLMKSGNFSKVPAILGVNKEEGAVFLKFIPKMAQLLEKYDHDIEELQSELTMKTFYGIIKSYVDTTGARKHPLLVNAINAHYWPSTPFGRPNGSQIYDAVVRGMSDYLFNCPTYKWAELMAENGVDADNIWVYHYTHRAKHDILPAWMGVTHAVELPIVFGGPLSDWGRRVGYSHDDKVFSLVMMEFWSNFVKFGNPNTRSQSLPKVLTGPLHYSEWKPYSSDECNPYTADMSARFQVYSIGKGYTCGFKKRDCSFWYDVFYKITEIIEGNDQ